MFDVRWQLLNVQTDLRETIAKHVDPETGEISEDGMASILALEGSQDSLLLDLACVVRELAAEAEGCAATLLELARPLEARIARATRLRRKMEDVIAEHVDVGTTLKDDRVEIGWGRKSTKVVIDDEKAIPEDLMRTPPTPKDQPDKALIKSVLEVNARNQTKVDWAHLETGRPLKIS